MNAGTTGPFSNHPSHHVVIVGGGFGGIDAARALGRAPVRVTLIDSRNFHLFQPLLYQVATGGLSPGNIASPIRAVLRHQRNTMIRIGQVKDIDPERRTLLLADGQVTYDTLILSPGMTHHYFGHDDWRTVAPGLKSLEDALEIRRRLFYAFEAAEKESDPEVRRTWMRFVIVGGGPTGVELAGAMGELAHTTLRDDFRVIDTRSSEILLVEGSDRVLPTFQPGLSKRAEEALKRLGVTVRTRTRTTRISSGEVELSAADGSTKETVPTRTVFWAAGMKPSGLGRILASKTGAELDRIGRVIVTSDLTVPGHPEIFVIGDLAHFRGPSGEPLPGIAPVAMQEGRFAAAVIEGRLRGRTTRPFRYRDKGVLAVIGRNAAVAQFGRRGFSGRLAWLLWLFVHIWYLIAYDNKILVLVQWAFHYLTRGRGVRLVTGESVSGESETSGYV